MSFEFKHIDDYCLIIPSEKQRAGNDFKAIVDKNFADDDLIFCLIEKTTLSDIDAIGETFLYSVHNKEEGKQLLEQYDEIINEVRDHFKFAISEFLDWYKKYSFILIYSNDVKFSFPSPKPNWEQDLKSQEKQKDRAKYAQPNTTELAEDDIIKYLNYYANILHDKLDFKNYPHYCIIVRPIAVVDGNTVIPLGNLYLLLNHTNKKSLIIRK